MRSIIPLVIIAGLVTATPTPKSPSSRQTAYDIPVGVLNDPSHANKRVECDSLLEDGCGPLDLQGTGLLGSDSGSGLLGASSEIAGLHLRHVKRGGLLGGLNTDVIGELNPLKGGGVLPDLDQPLGGIGLKRDAFAGPGENKRLLNFGRPSSGFQPKGNTCSAGRRYCCRHVRRYSDPRNAGLLDGALVQDGLLNDVLLGLTCDLLVGTLTPESCDSHAVCCTSQRTSKEGILNLGCTPWGVDISI